MAVQGRSDLTSVPFFLSGNTIVRDNETILTNGARSTPLKQYTLMAQVASSRKWVPLTSLTALDGSNTARGIYVGDDIPAATIVAGDVANCPIVVAGSAATFDSSQLVIENSLALTSVASETATGTDANGPVHTRLVQDDLAHIGLFAESTVDIDYFEN